MEEIIKITDLRLKTSETLNKIIKDGIIGIIVSRSTPKVVILSVEDYKEKERELKELRQKIFELECMQSEKEIKQGKVSGPFESASSLIEKIKNND